MPNGHDQTVYLVLDDFGRLGCAWRETDAERTDLEAIVTDLMTAHYRDPVTVVAFNLAERWAGDVSEDIAGELRRRSDLADHELSPSVEAFVERHVGHVGSERQLTLRLA
jgi:hypothetical protein